jgi:amidohydrolase
VHNVIPNQVDLIGSIRTLDQKQRERVHQEMEQIATGIASSLGGSCDFQVIKRYPPLVNDETATALVQKAAVKIVGKEKLKTAEPTMGGEDFSYITEQVPAAFFFVGIARDKPILHHNPYFAWDDEALKVSAAVLCQTAVDYLVGQ